jgi:hypothetical protein
MAVFFGVGATSFAIAALLVWRIASPRAVNLGAFKGGLVRGNARRSGEFAPGGDAGRGECVSYGRIDGADPLHARGAAAECLWQRLMNGRRCGWQRSGRADSLCRT